MSANCFYILLSVSPFLYGKDSLLLTFKSYESNKVIQVCITNICVPIYFISSDFCSIKSVLDEANIPYSKISSKPQTQYLPVSTEYCKRSDLIKVSLPQSSIQYLTTLSLPPMLNHTYKTIDHFFLQKMKKEGCFPTSFKVTNLTPMSDELKAHFKPSYAPSLFELKSMSFIEPIESTVPLPVVEIEQYAVYTIESCNNQELFQICGPNGAKTVLFPQTRTNDIVRYLNTQQCDVLIAFNFSALKRQTPHFSRLLNSLSIVNRQRNVRHYDIEGRVLCDFESNYRTLSGGKERKYTLEYLTTKHLGIETYDDSKAAIYLWQLCVKFEIINFTVAISTIAGVPLGNVSGVNPVDVQDWMLLHRFKHVRCIPPPKNSTPVLTSLNQGGLSLDPVRGVHTELTIEFDFSAYYPSIVTEKNICYDQENHAIFPPFMRSLVLLRKQWEEDRVPRIQIISLKLLTNKMYGRCDYPRSLFYNPKLGALISEWGRKTLQMAVDVARNTLQEYQPVVLYGMTDSIFVSLNTRQIDEVHDYVRAFCSAINENSECIKILPKEVFSKIIFYNQKNRYIALAQTYKPDMSALDDLKIIVKNKDTDEKGCPLLFKAVFTKFIQEVLLTDDEQAFSTFQSYFEQVIDSLTQATVDPKLLVFTKELSKAPSAYRADLTKKPPPYLYLAKDTDTAHSCVDFIIMKGGIVGPLEQIQSDPALIDSSAYIEKFLIPFALRLTDIPDFASLRAYFLAYKPTPKKDGPSTSNESRVVKRSFIQPIMTNEIELKMRLAHLQHRKSLTVQCVACKNSTSFFGLKEAERILLEDTFHSAKLEQIERNLKMFFETDGIVCSDYTCFYSIPFCSEQFTLVPVEKEELGNPSILINLNVSLFQSLGATDEIRKILGNLITKYSILEKFKLNI